MFAFGVVRQLFSFALDAVLPPRDREARTRLRKLEDIPLKPAVHELLGIRITTIMDYRNAATRDLIRSLKYDGSAAAASLAASALADYLREEIAASRQFSPREILLVPVPLHRSRKRERGFNQIEIVLRALPEEFRDGTFCRLAPEVLVRSRATGPQTKLPRVERIRNMNDAFVVPRPAAVRKAHVILIDDVATTGATLKHAGKPLVQCGTEVTLLALARA